MQDIQFTCLIPYFFCISFQHLVKQKQQSPVEFKSLIRNILPNSKKSKHCFIVRSTSSQLLPDEKNIFKTVSYNTKRFSVFFALHAKFLHVVQKHLFSFFFRSLVVAGARWSLYKRHFLPINQNLYCNFRNPAP